LVVKRHLTAMQHKIAGWLLLLRFLLHTIVVYARW
jgi:hypothetical protein